MTRTETVAAIIEAESQCVDKEIVIFKWLRTCDGYRERVFAAAKIAQAVAGGKYKAGDLVTVGYNSHADKILMAAPGRGRIVAKVQMEADDATKVVERLGWRVVKTAIPDDAPPTYLQNPYQWILDNESTCQEAAR